MFASPMYFASKEGVFARRMRARPELYRDLLETPARNHLDRLRRSSEAPEPDNRI